MIKQMSLIALGAATLFMAPTVVHANDGVPTEKTGTATFAVGKDGLKSKDDGTDPDPEPGGGNFKIEQAPVLNFNKMTHVDTPRGVQSTDGNLKVDNTKGVKQWNVKVKTEGFSLVGEKEIVKGAEIQFLNADVTLASGTTGPLPEYNANQVLRDNGNQIKILSGIQGTNGVYEVNIGGGNAFLTLRSHEYPEGDHTADMVWTLEVGE